MSQQNDELVRRALDAFNRRELEAFLAFLDPDVEFTAYSMQLEGGDPYRGHEGVRAWWENILAVYPDFSVEIEDVREFGDLTITRLRMNGRGVESGAAMDQEVWQVVRIREGQGTVVRFFGSEVDALEAAGLSE
jgi:ketosteroid isomerase-like protein